MAKNQDVDDELERLLSEYAEPGLVMSNDYRKVNGYCVAGWDAMDNFAMRKVLEFEDISPGDVHALLVQAIDEGRTLRDVVGDAHPDLVQRILDVTAIVGSFEQDPDTAMAELDALLNLDDAIKLRTELDRKPIRQAGARNVEDEEAIETADIGPPVEAMPIVRSKGLSAQHVIVIGCDDLNMGRVTPFAFFVAMTRARLSLHIVTSLKSGGRPHPYLADIPGDSCDYWVYKKSGRVLTAKKDWDSLADYLNWMQTKILKGR
ncbi:MAG: hypothetical protein ABL953_12730 [Ilumatobacteraceae bacterium]